MDEKKKTEIEAEVFKKLVKHFRNEDIREPGNYIFSLFGTDLAELYRLATKKKNIKISEDEAQKKIFGMYYKKWRFKHYYNLSGEQKEMLETLKELGITEKNQREVFRTLTKSEKYLDPVVSQLVLEKVLKWFRKNTDTQNIDLMEKYDFCRNCLSKWYMASAKKKGIKLDYEEARKIIYGMSYDKWKKKYQKPLSEDE